MTTAATTKKIASDSTSLSSRIDRFPSRLALNATAYDRIRRGTYWDLVREACPPNSVARGLDAIDDFSNPPAFPTSQPYGTVGGYIVNWTIAKDPCLHPHLRGLHGKFIEPTSLSTSKKLFPIFGGSKLPITNEIPVPAPRYWTSESQFTGKNLWSCLFGTVDEWDKKYDKLIWRGATSGGRNRAHTWTHFHRHRFLSMLNATHVSAAQQKKFDPQNFILPVGQPYDVAADMAGVLSSWISLVADGAFTDLECFPETDKPHCIYTEEYYRPVKETYMYRQFAYKFLPDVDGNAFSGRYPAFLLSSSLPIKATVYNEWHNSRLFPWVHFVPMDNTFIDLYGIMDFFMGYQDDQGVVRRENS